MLNNLRILTSRFRCAETLQMKTFKALSANIEYGRKREADDENEPEVWRLLEPSAIDHHDKRASRLRKAKKFLKTMETKEEASVVCGRNVFSVSDREVMSIELPPSPPATANNRIEPPLPAPIPEECGPPKHLPPLPREPSPASFQPPPPRILDCRDGYDDELETAASKNPRSFDESNSSSRVIKEFATGIEFVKYLSQGSRESLRSMHTSSTSQNMHNRLASRRSWTPPDKHFKEEKAGQLGVRLMSYNVLAQNLLESNQFLYRGLDTEHLVWRTRWIGIQEEVLRHKPDIVCFQEVQFRKPSHFQSDYLPFFENEGYRAVFKCRTGDKQDGCVIFYKMAKFKLDYYSLVEYRRPEVPLLDRDNIGVVCRLIPRNRTDLPALVVATTHLLFNQKRTDIRLAQAAILLAEIDRVSREGDSECPVLVCGDFNANPSSEVYTLFNQGYVKYEGSMSGRRPMPRELLPQRFGLTDSCQWDEILRARNKVPMYGSGTFSNSFRFRSVYQDYEQPEFYNKVVSTNHGHWTIVDYIFMSCSTSKLDLISRFMLPRQNDMEEIGRIPSDVSPSDHFLLLADFALKSR